jgi:energy-coupling factor transporter ATP-binding protein EcfA2
VTVDTRHLTFQFEGADRPALDDVSLHVDPGEFVLLTGPSGCGKSTLALAIGGYLFRQYAGRAEGTVSVGGLDARHSEIYDLADIVGLVQQNPENQFCTLTVADEVAFGLENRCLPRDEILARVDWALGVVHAQHLEGRHLATLSGGEKQKVAIAAMMAARPRVLIFDEPTSNLDPTATRDILRVITDIRLREAITTIVIEHKVGYLLALLDGGGPFSARLVRMEQARIVADRPVRREEVRLYDVSALGQSAPVGDSVTALPHEAETAIAVQDLCFAYEGQAPVLQDVTLDVPRGQFVAVMGDNGAGKSTLLRCMLGLLKPTSGSITVLGRDTRRTLVSELARQVGFVFQNPDHQIFAETVWEEAILAVRNLLGEEHTDRASALLRRAGLDGYRDRHPYRLSYGEKRRLNVVSVLAYGPQVVLLDEVLIGQDAENASFLMGLLRDAVDDGATVISVTHDPATTLRHADRVLYLAQGRVVGDGSPPEIVASLPAFST